MQYINKLPAVFQTVTEKKFFDATFDQVFSKKDSDYLAGFLGRRNPGFYNPITDFYIPEPSKNRTWWQLESTVFARNPDSSKTNIFFYEDLLDRIEFYDGNTLNQDRLFQSEYYSFGPPIDYDMFINYHNYYWIEQGLPLITITGVLGSDIIGQPSYTTPETANPPNLTLTTGMNILLVDDPLYPDPVVVENFGGCTGIKLIPKFSDFTAGAIFELLPWDGVIELSNGRTIDNRFWDVLTWDTQTQPSTGDYITIERGALDRNAWSRTNKWFHIDAITATLNVTGSGFPINSTRALRPIIQFIADIPLYKSGTQFRSEIKFGFRDNNFGEPIRRVDYQGQLLTDINDDFDIQLSNGDLIGFFNDDTPFNFWDIEPEFWDVGPPPEWDAGFGKINQFIYQVVVNNDGTVDFQPYTSWDTPVLEGDIVFILEDGPWNAAQRGQTWYYSQGIWQKAFNDKIFLNQAPLFLLYDHNGIPLDDPITYPNSNFNGSKIFSYKINTEPGATVDPVLKFPIVYSSLRQATDIIFENTLITDRYTYGDNLPIDGYYYYKTSTEPILYNNWNLYQPCNCSDIFPPPPANCLETSKQRVIDKFVVGYGAEYQFRLSVSPYGYPLSPDIIVSVNGEEVKNSSEQVNGYAFVEINNRIYVDLSAYLTELMLIPQKQPPVVETQTYTHDLLDPESPGYFEIPQQLDANPLQEEITEISASNLIDHFSSIIASQINFNGSPFGGSNNYRDTRKNRSMGKFILQNVNPLLKTMLVSSENDLDFILALRFSQDEYTKFKNKYLQTALQLINQEFNPVQYYNNTISLNMWVDEILKVVNVSKEFSNAFAYSYMIANGSPIYTEEHVVPISGNITLTNYIDLNNLKNAIYIYDTTTNEYLLTIGKDYEIVSTNLAIDIQINTLNIAPGNTIVVAFYENPLPAYIPSTPSKIGAYPIYIPRIELDTSYAVPTNVIIGHDGSKTIAYGDYRDQLLLELETRIYNLIQFKYRNQYYLPIRLESVKPGYFRTTRYSRQEYLDLTESYLNKWSAKNRANYRTNDWESSSLITPVSQLWKLYNYRVAEDATTGQPLNLPGNWKGIFQYYYDTYYPDTRPWEMLGFSSEPGWWRYEYGNPILNLAGQEVWPSTASGANNMYADLEVGIIRQGPSALYDPISQLPLPQEMWARPGLSSIIPVDTAGEIIPVPALFNVVFSGNPYEPFDGYDLDWKYGDGAPVEQAWMSTSGYAFTVQEILMNTRPAPYGEYMWDTYGTELSPGPIDIPGIEGPVRSEFNWQFVQNDTYENDDPFFKWMRPKNSTQIVHAENIDNNIQIRFGYQRWISDRILFLGKNVSDIFGQKIRTLGVNLANKIAGFTNKDTTNIYIESVSPESQVDSLIVPSNNFEVLLHKSPPVETYSYSGVIIRGLADGTFAVYGYDLINAEFLILDRSNAQLIDITVGGTPAEFTYFTIGATYKEGDIVRYNGIYYLNLITQVADSFIDTRWKRLNALPIVGGISVSYKPISEEKITKVPYGTIFKTPQEVFDLLIGWGAYLESQGWKFDEVNQDTNQLNDWLSAGKQFLFWLNSDWGPDSSIQLSPLANKATLEVRRGYPNNVEFISNGVYSILDKFGVAIPPNSTQTDRDGRLISVQPSNLASGGIYYLLVTTSETEHILMIDNVTSFNDTIYSPLLRTRQQRIRFNGFRSNNWFGKMEAPGYLVIDDQLVPNYDTIVNDMRYYYDPNVTIDNPSLEDLGRHLIGYESKSYLDNLQISNDVQYLFYKGSIRQKGTEQAFTKLFRSTKVQSDEAIKVYEEWALKVGEFGSTIDNVSTEFILRPEQNTGEVVVARLSFVPSKIGFVRQINILNAENRYTKVPKIIVYPPDADPLDPDLTEPLRIAKAYAVLDSTGRISRIDITDPGYGYLDAPYVEIDSGSEPHNLDRLYSVWQGASSFDSTLDNVINIDVDQVDKWVRRPNEPEYSLKFPLTDKIEYSIPNSGYVNFNDVNWHTFDPVSAALNWGTIDLNPEQGQTLWVAKTFTDDWAVYKLIDETSNSAFDVIKDDNGNLFLRTQLPFKLIPESSEEVGVENDFGNLVAFQIVEAQAIAYKPFELAQVQPFIPKPASAISGLTQGQVTSLTVIDGGAGLDDTASIVIDPPVLTQAIITANISSGQVVSLNIVDGGAGYATTPSVIFEASPDFSIASASLTITNGVVTGYTITNPGSGYITPPTTTVTPPDGTAALAEAIIEDGVLTGFEILFPGSGYFSPPVVNIENPSDVYTIREIRIINPGDGYDFTPTITITGDGIGATASVIIDEGSIIDVIVTNPGSGYNFATSSLTTTDGQVRQITVTKSGINYLVPPDVQILENGVTFLGATARANIEGGKVVSIDVLSTGAGYTNPVVIISPPAEVPPEASYALGFEYDSSDAFYNLYKIVNLDGVQLTDQEVPEYVDFTKFMIFKNLRSTSIATATITIDSNTNSISSVNLVSGGVDYISAPTVIINGDGTGATATATISNGSVTSITLDNPGTGYSYASISIMPPNNESYIAEGDKIWIDNMNGKWSVLKYNTLDISQPPLTPFRIQEPLINTSLFKSAKVYSSSSQDELILLQVFDPYKDILPGPARQNISFISMQDPARYNVTGDPRLFSENITFGEPQVGMLWWDTSISRYTYYEQPIALDGSETDVDNLVYRRDRWGQLFPGSVIAIYEWVRSDVPPDQYTGPGTPRSTDTYVQIITSNKFTTDNEINYYFWVLNSNVLPDVENRTVPALEIARLLQSPKSQNFTFFSPVQQNARNNSYMFYNVLEILSFRGDNIQIEYRLKERNDQSHAQWAFFREGDENSIVTDQFWNKMVDSLCGYTKVLEASEEFDNSIIVAKDLPWDIYGWDISLWDTATTSTTAQYGIVLPVPDPMLTEDEKYGIEYRPRQGMFRKLKDARKIFVQAANSLLKNIPIRDDDAGWNSDVNTSIYWEYTNWYKVGYENVRPSVVFQTLAQANIALLNNELSVGTVIQVNQGTVDGRFVLYAVIQPDSNINVYSLEEVGIQDSAIKLLDTIYLVNNKYNLSVELRELLNAFRAKVMVNNYLVDQNVLFFSMINYVLSEQKSPDWVFKSSYIYIKEDNIPLNQTRLFTPDQAENVISYIEDVKPYHTKIRDYTSTYITSDLAFGTAFDNYKFNIGLYFGPAVTGRGSPGHWDEVCNEAVEGITEGPWEGYAWDVCPEPTYVLNARTFLDNIEQFVSREDVYTVPLTFFDISKRGMSQLFPYTFTFDDINLNNPQTFITPSDIVGIQIGSSVLIYGQDYYVENNNDSTYTVYFYNDPGNSPTPIALVWFNGGGMQPFKFNTSRNEVAYGFPKDNINIVAETKLPVNNVLGTPIGTLPDPIIDTYSYAPLVGWGDSWESVGNPVADIIVAEGGIADIPWDTPLNTVILDNYTISSRESQNSKDNDTYYRNSYEYSGVLVNDLPAPTQDTEFLDVITVYVDPITHPITTNILPTPTSVPGVIWINGERIEYRNKEQIAPDTWELRLVRRGTLGTSAATQYSYQSEIGSAPMSIVSITIAGNIATVTTSNPHGLSTGNFVSLYNTLPISYNTPKTEITVIDANTFTYEINVDTPVIDATDPGTFNVLNVQTPVWIERNNIMPSDSDTIVWNATSLPVVPDVTSENPDNHFSKISNVPAGGLWYANTPQSVFLKDSLSSTLP